MEKSVGDICQKCSSFQWKIADFTSMSNKNGDPSKSPPFDCFDAVWNIKVYANGFSEDDIGWISLFLYKLHPKGSNHIMDYKVCIKYEDKIIRTLQSLNCFTVYSYWGWSKFIKRSEILDKMKISLQKALTINVVVTWRPVGSLESQNNNSPKISSIVLKPKEGWEVLIHDLKRLYLSKSYSDITIKVKEQEFPAHKVILGARSSVFAASFAHDMVENLSGIMKIDDFEPQTVNAFLKFIYTGDIENLSPSNVFELYAISHKYDVKNLTEKCLEFMKRNIRLKTVCDILLHAELYSEIELFQLAKDFVAKHSTDVLTSDQWEELANGNIFLAHKILKLVVLDNSWRIK